MLKKIVFVLLAACIFMGGCSGTRKSRHLSDNSNLAMGPRVYIYKTRGDYNLQVPICLSSDKKSIVSYPDIKDVLYNGKLITPTILSDNYLLDNRGISGNVAFLKLTYQQYAVLPATPSPESLFNLILDSDPLSVLYDCGKKSDYQNLTDDLNNLITINHFSGFKKLK